MKGMKGGEEAGHICIGTGTHLDRLGRRTDLSSFGIIGQSLASGLMLQHTGHTYG